MSNVKSESKILAAATKEFLKNGYSGARMQEIADKAGLNKALLHYYYKTKEQLYGKVMEVEFSLMIVGIISALESEGDFETWLKGVIHQYLHAIASRPNFSRFMLWELNSEKKRIPALFARLISSKGYSTNPILDKVQEKLNSAGLTQHSPTHFLLNLLSLCIFPSLAMPILDKVIGHSDKSFAFIKQREEEIFRLMMYGYLGCKERR